MDSILISVKKLLGITAEYKHFDTDLIIHINSVFSILTQLGVGPSSGFSIQDEYAIWTDFIDEDPRLEMVKTYIHLKVRLMFDPPDRSVVADAIKRQIDELEFRLMVAAEEVADKGTVVNGFDFTY
jgi:hypothetical protein